MAEVFACQVEVLDGSTVCIDVNVSGVFQLAIYSYRVATFCVLSRPGTRSTCPTHATTCTD